MSQYGFIDVKFISSCMTDNKKTSSDILRVDFRRDMAMRQPPSMRTA